MSRNEKKIQVSCKQTCVRTHDHTRPSVRIHTQAGVRASTSVHSCVHVSKSVLVFQISPVRHMSHNLPNWTAIPDSQKDTRRHKIKPRGFPRVPKTNTKVGEQLKGASLQVAGLGQLLPSFRAKAKAATNPTLLPGRPGVSSKTGGGQNARSRGG